tara:strand:- start:10 stop:495 length:486 start_codon:yes stop_codon:yes gene_type:complete
MKALYPGSFDPLTLGHLDLIQRGLDMFGELVIAVLENPTKSATFSLERRLLQIKNATKDMKNIEIVSFDGLTVHCAREYKANLILRGLRAMSDFEYELQIAHINRTLDSEFETVFLATETHHSFLSSSVVKEVAMFGGNVDHMVPKIVAEDLYSLLNKRAK